MHIKVSMADKKVCDDLLFCIALAITCCWAISAAAGQVCKSFLRLLFSPHLATLRQQSRTLRIMYKSWTTLTSCRLHGWHYQGDKQDLFFCFTLNPCLYLMGGQFAKSSQTAACQLCTFQAENKREQNFAFKHFQRGNFPTKKGWKIQDFLSIFKSIGCH